jgi:hypothetical protein
MNLKERDIMLTCLENPQIFGEILTGVHRWIQISIAEAEVLEK